MDVPDTVLQCPLENINEIDRELMSVAIGCAKVLNSLSSSPKIKEELRKFGVVFLMSRFLKSQNVDLIIPMMGSVQQCADLVRLIFQNNFFFCYNYNKIYLFFQKSFRLAFEQMGIIGDVIHHLKNENVKLKENCALVIFKCAENKVTRDLVREAGGLDPLCKLIQSDQVRSNKELLASVTGGIWKCAMSPENIIRFNQNELVVSIIPLLEENEDEDVLTNVVGALAECCKDPKNRDVLRINDGIQKLVSNFFKIEK